MGIIDVTPLLVQGATIKSILQEAAKLNADMIVIGSHGHGALYKTLVGSVSEGVICQASCPVLIVPAKKIIGVADWGHERHYIFTSREIQRFD